jgi:hypothetical protein
MSYYASNKKYKKNMASPFCFYKQEYGFLIMREYKNQMLFDNAWIIKAK